MPKTFPMRTLEHRLRGAVNVSVDGRQEMAGFAVSINGRFWVSTEAEIQEDALVSAVMSVDVAPLGDTLRVSAPRRIFGDAVTHPMTDSRRHADYTPDGQRMLARQRHGALERPVRLIINWAEPLRQP